MTFLYILITGGFFALTLALVNFFEKLKGSGA